MFTAETLRSIILALTSLVGGYFLLRATSAQAATQLTYRPEYVYNPLSDSWDVEYVPMETPAPITNWDVEVIPAGDAPGSLTDAQYCAKLIEAGFNPGDYGIMCSEDNATPTGGAPAINSADANLKAFGDMIGRLEANGSYTALVGGGELTDLGLDFSQHPAKFRNAQGKRIWPGWVRPDGRRTFAAGKYQVTESTWDDYLARAAPASRGFSPAEQDAFFVWKLKDRGAYQAVSAGRFNEAFQRLTNEWEALARILAGNYYVDYDGALEIYMNGGGAVA